MKIKTTLSKLFLIGTVSFTIASFLISDDAFAEYFLVYDAPLAVCMSGCGGHHRYHRARHHRYKHRYIARRYRSGYSIATYYVWRDVPACAYAPACGGGCCNSYIPASYSQTQFYDVYYRQPEYYRDYSDRYDYNNDMRTGDDVAIGMDIDY